MSSTEHAAGRRAAIIAICVASLLVCCALAWWQWQRYSSAGGSFQNLGYVLQWPLFGLFPAFMFWRMRQLRRRERAAQAERPIPVPEGAPAPGPAVRQPENDDGELAAYNAYLAALNAQDNASTKRGRSTR